MPLLSTIGAAAARAFGFLRALVTGGNNVANSLRFNSGSSDYLSRTPSSTGNRQIFTISCWVKRSTLTASGKNIMVAWDGAKASANFGSAIYFNSSDQIEVDHDIAGSDYTFNTDMVFRDVSAWYHIVLAVDTTQATAANRQTIYVNGSSVTLATSALGFPIQNFNTFFNSSGCENDIGSNYFTAGYADQYMSEFYLIDGQALTASSFGETDPAIPSSGIWIPKAYTGSFGTNGFYQKYANSAALGTDSSGNGNNFTVNNLTSVDQSTDTPTNNFCTLNPLDAMVSNPPTFSNGNLTVSTASSGASACRSTFSVDKGKWYWEIKKTSASSADTIIGIQEQSEAITNYIGSTAKGYGYISTGIKVNNTSQVSYGATYTNGDIIGVALDMDNGTLIFYKNGVSQGTAYSSLSGLFSPAHSDGGTGTETADCNFGSPPYAANSYADAAGYGNFSYAVPAGYYSLNTKNLADYG